MTNENTTLNKSVAEYFHVENQSIQLLISDFRRDVPSVHRQVGRQFSNSTCSVDSGYTRSLGSSAAAYAFYDLGSSGNIIN